jgi:hypothetical protein
MKYFIVLSYLILAGFTSCKKKKDNVVEYAIDWSIPEKRTFYMGFTAFPYDVSSSAVSQSYSNQASNGDILLTHFDHGVPWNEALNNQPFPNEVQTAINESIANTSVNHKVLLTATDTDRDKLAKYWNNNVSQQPLPAFWQQKSFNSPEVIQAFRNYCHRIIDAIQPNYFAFGIEINATFLATTQEFKAYLELAKSVYNDLKQSYPNIPIMLTFQDQSFNKTKDELKQLTSILLQYSDMVAVSSYPFWQYDFPSREANPKLFDKNWLKEMRDLAPNKPFAVSETGFCAENLKLPNYGVDIKGKIEWQNEYVQKLLTEANKLNAEFILWFVYRDLDLLENNLPTPNDALKIWRDNGLEDGGGNKRSSYYQWHKWKKLSVN